MDRMDKHDVYLEIRESLVLKKPNALGIFSLREGGLVCYYRGFCFPIVQLWLLVRGQLWTENNFPGALLARSGRHGDESSFVLIGQNDFFIGSSLDDAPDLTCIALIDGRGNSDDEEPPICMKASFHTGCSSVVIMKDSEICKLWQYEGKQLANSSIRIKESGSNEVQGI